MKRWCRFSLATFLVIVALCAAWLALKVNQARNQREVAEKIAAMGGEVRFLSGLNPRLYPNEQVSVEPAWLRKLTGDDYFVTVALASIQGKEVTDDDLKELARVNTFRKLAFCNSLVSDDGLKHLKGMRHLRRLRLDGSRITDAGLAHIGGLKSLEVLFLSDTSIQGDGFGHLNGCSKLEWLALSNSRITDASIKHLANLGNLEILDLSNTEISDEVIDHIVANFPKLKTIDLSWTQVSDEGVRKLMAMPNLYDLELWGTGVTRSMRDELAAWRMEQLGIRVPPNFVGSGLD